MRTEVIPLPWNAPPMRSNDRYGHWAVRHRAVLNVAEGTHWAARKVAPFSSPVVVTGVWTVTNKRVRDAGSMAPTVKAAIDALVRIGVLASGDDWRAVTEERYRIELGDRPGFRIEIASVQ